MAVERGHPSRGPDMERVYRAHRDVILRFCRSRLGDPATAEDITQEVFSAALRRQPQGDPRAWLFTVASRLVARELMRRSRNVREVGEGDANTRDPDPAEVAARRDLARRLMRALTPGERRVVVRTVVLDRSHGETARSLGISASTSRVLESRALAKLRRLGREGLNSVTPRLLPAPFRLPRLSNLRLLSPGPGRAGLAIAASVTLALLTATTRPQPPGPSAVAGRPPQRQAATALGPRPRPADTAARHRALRGLTATQWLPPTGPGLPTRWILPSESAVVYDMQASPAYASDHSLFLIADNPVSCSCPTLFRSADGGHSWDRVSSGVGQDHLVLPLDYIACGCFYAYDPGLAVTRDGGRSWTTLKHQVDGYAGPGAWPGADVVVSDDIGITGYGAVDGRPHLGPVFSPGTEVQGPPQIVAGGSGPVLLQAEATVGDTLTAGKVGVIRCDLSGCSSPSPTPLDRGFGVGWAQGLADVLVMRPPGPRGDRIVVAANPSAISVSDDGGVTFGPARAFSPGYPVTLASTITAGHLRIVGVFLTADGGERESVSDDLGASWRAVEVLGGPIAPQIILPLDGQHLVEAGSTAPGGAPAGFDCSADAGETWAPC